MNNSNRAACCLRALTLSALLLVLATSAAFAQLSTASLNGVIRDPSGAVLPHANVVLRNVETAVDRNTVSNDAGLYVFLNINPGRYTLSVKAQGFTEKKVNEFVLGVNQTATVDVALAVGSDTQVVTVEAEAEQLQVSNADLGTVISTRQVNDLPLNGRNFTQLLSLTPGVAPISVAQNNMGGRPGGFGAPISVGSTFTFPAINGQTNRSNFFLTDGLFNFGSFQSTYAVPPIIDAIQEFKVVSHTDSAEFGSVLGGVVNVVTKGGTNDLHGSAWEYLRNSAFNSRPGFLGASAKTPGFRENQFGVSVGGPVWIPKLYNGRNKTFFFFSYQGLRYSQDSATLFLVPTDAELGGDFSQSPILGNNCGPHNSDPCQIYNPFSTNPDRPVFAGRIIPSDMIDQRMVTWAKAIFPAAGPYDPTTNSNAIDTTPTTQTQNEYNIRVDQNFGQKNTVFFRYSSIASTLSKSGGLPGIIAAEDIPGKNWGGSFVHVFNPSLILQLQYARATNADNTNQRFKTLNAADFDQQIGFSDTFASGFAGVGGGPLIPSPGINGYGNGGDNVELTPKATDTHEIKGTLTKILGSHTVVFGGGYTSAGFASPISYASLTYAAGQTGNAVQTQAGDALASFLLNVPDGANRRNVNEQLRPGGVMSGFLQDSWKATSKLTLNFGLRYDLTFIPPYGTDKTIGQEGGIETGEPDFSNGTYIVQKVPPTCDDRGFAPCIPNIMLDANGNAVSCDPSTQTCLPAGTLGPHVVVDPRGKIPHNDSKNFGPRIGFAYRLGDKTVIRGAYGIVYDNWAAVTQMAQNFEGSWPDIGQQIANNLNQPGALPSVTGQNPFATTGAFPAANPFNQVQWFYDPHLRNPYSEQWNFGVQREINASTTLDVNYVGSGSHRTNVGGYYNTDLTPGLTEDPARRPYPYITPTFYDRSIGTASYNAAQVELKKRMTNGLFYQVSYTYSKSLDEGSSGWFGVEGQSLTDPYNIKGSRGPSGFDLTHTLSVSMLYQVPIGKGKRFSTHNGVLDYIIGNWQVNNLFTARSGAPFNVFWGADDRAHTGNVSWAQYLRANQVGDPWGGSCPDGSKVGSANCFFNTSAFEAPPEGTFGTSGRDAYRSAPFWDLTSSVFRQFPFGETRRIEFRAEAFNLFNTVIFGQPGNDVSSGSNFGKVTSAGNTQRQLQFSLKVLF